MAYRNQHDHTGKCSQNGARAENLFRTIINNIGGTATPSSLAEQFKGIDYHVDLSGKVDVKSRGRNRRGDDSPDAKRIWLELKNVQGRKGWVYNDADYIAFERKNRYLVVERISICELIDNLVDMSEVVLCPDLCMYNLYSRVGRKDLLTKVHVNDLLTCSHYILPKPNEDSID